MLALWSPEDDHRQRALPHLPGDREVRSAGSWEAFRQLYPEAECAVVMAPDPPPELLARLGTLKRRHPDRPVLLVTRRDPAALRRLKDVVLEEVVWTDALEDELAPALRRADAERRFRRLQRELEAAASLPPTLARALALALRRRPPLTSVQALAGEVERDRRTLWHHWDNAVGEDAELTMKGFLDRVLLLRAAACKNGGRSWREVSAELDVHPRTLRRVAGRHSDRPLQELPDDAWSGLFDAFEREVMGALLSFGAAEAGDRPAERSA